MAEQTNTKIIRSEIVQEIVSKRQSFISRWSLFIIALIILLLAAASWFIQYPEIIKTTAILNGINTPKEVVAKEDGKLIKWYVKNGDNVKENQVIGWIESNADHEQVEKLSDIVDSVILNFQYHKKLYLSNYFKTGFFKLGELQNSFQQFSIALQQYDDYFVNGFFIKKRKILVDEIAAFNKNGVNLEEQHNILTQDLDLSSEGYAADESLFRSKVISKQDYRQEKSKLLNKKIIVKQLEANINTNESLIHEKQKEIIELDHSIVQQEVIFKQSIQTLKSYIDEWKRKYLLCASIRGAITFNQPIQENRYLKANQVVAIVVPQVSKYYVEINIPQNNFGKIKPGEEVLLRFDAYPYTEFGSIRGKLNFVSNIATDSGFVGEVVLPAGLNTDQGNSIQFKNGLKAEAFVITKDVKMFKRLFYTITKAINEK